MPTSRVSPSGRSRTISPSPTIGLLVLRDLIARRQIGIEIVLPVEHRVQIDLRLEAEPGAHRLLDAVAVDHRQHARHRRIDEADLGVGLGAELGRGAGEQLRLGRDLGMDLQADHDLPLAGRAFDHELRRRASLIAPSTRLAASAVKSGGLFERARRRAARSPRRRPCRSAAARAAGRPRQPRRHRNPRQAGEIHRHGEHVVQIHRDRIVRSSRRWRRRPTAWPASAARRPSRRPR